MFKVPLNIALIDSFTFFVDVNDIEILDYKLVTPYQIFYEDTAEILDEINPPKAIISDKNGIKFRFQRVVWTHPLTKIQTEMICITVTTKMLQKRYFEGINWDNIDLIIDYINSQKVIKISKDTFLYKSKVNDIDICVNYQLDFNAYKTALKLLYEFVKPSKKHLVELFPKKEVQRVNENFGIMFNKRDNALNGSPFIKYYNKTYELINNSAEFYNLYIFEQVRQGLQIDNIIRKETTIKNAKAKENLFKKKLIRSITKLESVSDMLNLEQFELDSIINSQLKNYFDKKQFAVKSDLSPVEKALSYYQQIMVDHGCDKLQLLYPIQFIECPVTKSRLKKKLEEIMDLTFNQKYMKKKLEENSTANQFIRMQNIW